MALHRGQHGLFVVVQDQRKEIDHLAIPTRLPQHLILQLPESCRQLRERSAVPEGAGLTLDHREIMPPIVDRPRRQLM